MSSLLRQFYKDQSNEASRAEGEHTLLRNARDKTESHIFDLVNNSVDQLLQRYSTITDVENVKEEVRQDILALITDRAHRKGISLGEEYRMFLKDPESKQKILQAFKAAMDRPVAKK